MSKVITDTLDKMVADLAAMRSLVPDLVAERDEWMRRYQEAERENRRLHGLLVRHEEEGALGLNFAESTQLRERRKALDEYAESLPV